MAISAALPTDPARLPTWFGPAALGAVGLAGCAVVATVDPRESGNYPTCPFLALTGQHCPGCGTLRGLNRLFNGDLGAAIGFNLFMVAMIPIVGLAYLRWAFPSTIGARVPSFTRLPVSWLYGLAVAVLAFWLLRNVGGPFAALAP